MGEKSCNQVRVCQRCDVSDKDRTRHERWGESYSVDEDTMAHECERCGVVVKWTVSDGD